MQEVKTITSPDGSRRILFSSGNAKFSYWEEIRAVTEDGNTKWMPNSFPRTNRATLEEAIEDAKVEFNWATNL